MPAYYVERKRQLDEIAGRKETEGGLMSQLSAGILSEGIAAQTRPREGKIPAEIVDEDGTVRYPSGFEVPTPATEFHPVAALPPLETDEPLVKDGKVSWEEALAPPESDQLATAPTSSQGSLGVRGFHTSAIARAREIALDLVHARAIPPHLQQQPKAPKAPKAAEPAKASSSAPRKELAEEEHEEDEEDTLDEELVMDLSDGVPPVTNSLSEFNATLKEHREKYLATLKEEPFWRPVFTASFSTRPLAVSYARLSRGMPMGMPFYASIDVDDRKISTTFSARMHHLRVRRMRQLAIEIGRRLRGDFGGFPGIRFDVHDRGRGVDGEGFAAPIPADKRVIHVGIGGWHPYAGECRELLETELKDLDLTDGFEIFGLDEHGRRVDGVEWRRHSVPMVSKRLEPQVFENGVPPTARERLAHFETIPDEERRRIAYALAQNTGGVLYPKGSFKEAKLKDYAKGNVPIPDTV